MNTNEWLDYAEINKEKLINFVSYYHPRNYGSHKKPMIITAPFAEHAYEVIRREICKEVGFDFNPEVEIKEAIVNKDIAKIDKLLNEAWFGVPESTKCWNIDGFSEAVSLMENLPDEY